MRLWKALSSRVRFRSEFKAFLELAGPNPRFSVRWKDRYPCLYDRDNLAGFDRHYFFHLAWAARVLAESRPPVHVDISSHLQFCATVSAFVPFEFYEYHPPQAEIEGLTVNRANLLALPFDDISVMSLSCMHVVEHVGLGRYGDALDPDGDVKSMNELKRVLAEKGQLLFVVPVGQPRLHFNAHRIYAYDQILDCFSGLRLKEFALIPDDWRQGGLIRDASREMANAQRYGCGCFLFTRE